MAPRSVGAEGLSIRWESFRIRLLVKRTPGATSSAAHDKTTIKASQGERCWAPQKEFGRLAVRTHEHGSVQGQDAVKYRISGGSDMDKLPELVVPCAICTIDPKRMRFSVRYLSVEVNRSRPA